MKTRRYLAASALLTFAAFQASAAVLPQPKTQNGISYISGGIGLDESTAIKAEAKNYPLSLVFAAGSHNEYLANVKFTIKDKSGKEVLNATGTGPIVLVNLPAGEYTILADRNGADLRRTVHVNHHGEKSVVFHWEDS